MDIMLSIIVAVLVALPPTITAIASLIVSLRNSSELHSVSRQTNGRVDELLKEVSARVRAETLLEERERVHRATLTPPEELPPR